MQLDRVATDIVLANVRAALRPSRARLREELRALGAEASLASFLERTGLDLHDLYRGSKPGWVQLQRSVEPEVEPFLRAVARHIHLDSRVQLAFLARLLQHSQAASSTEERMVSMFERAFGPGWHGHSMVREELSALVPVLESRIDHLDHPLDEHPDVPLRVHCHYSLDEVLAALEVPYRIQSGVHYHKASGCDLFFVTVRKNERDYSPTTLYRDYAVCPEIFHWESQNVTREDSATGRRYQSHRGPTHALLFVRETAHDQRGFTSPYLFLGPAHYVSHEGERPMAILWKLKWPIPIQFYRGLRLAA
ncbi:MAG: DUF3427 domain-containing protein [Vulcanimicrobiota bacterium]